MAIFLSRIKQILNLGTKSITANGTYTASSDGYDGYSSVSVSVPTPPSITPSNSSPAALTSGSAVTPSANGYAISSYSSVTPSNSSPVTLNSYNPVIPLGNGYAIENYSNVTPTSSPSLEQSGFIKLNSAAYVVNNMTDLQPYSTPQNIYSGNTYNCMRDGVVVDEIRSITPSNSSPVALTADTPVNPTASGYAISSYSSKTPSDSSPASVSSGAIIKASSAGYLYKSSGLGKCKAGTFTSSTSAQTINLGFQPKYIMVMSETRTTNIFDYSYSSTKGVYAASSAYPSEYTISGNTSNNRISAITSTGFTFNKSGSSGATMYYFAVG